MSSTTILFGPPSAQFAPKHRVLVAPKELLRADSLPGGAQGVVAAVADGRETEGRAWVEGTSYTVAALETKTSRNLGVIRSDVLEKVVKKSVPGKEDVQLDVVLAGREQAWAAANAVARAFPTFNRKSSAKDSAPRTLRVSLSCSPALTPEEYTSLNTLATSIRHAAHLVDAPTSELDCAELVREVEAVGKRHGELVKTTVITGEALREAGLGAIYGVGKAATVPPALAVLEYTPPSSPSSSSSSTGAGKGVKLSLVGKGIVYDTGGLSIKSTANMCEMKGDMGGASALLGAFDALCAMRIPFPVVFVGCIAENAVGPDSQRNDDIVTPLSGKTIEINNTDAEGRLVLADGIAYTSLHHAPTHIIDMATLTGAQMVALGLHHAGVLAKSKPFEDLLLAAGHASGDWCFPMLYAPEILMQEFDSKVADMRNSVKDRSNAQASCAGHFVEAHIDGKWEGEWAHVDIAGPAFREGRATGYGVALVVEVARKLAGLA